MWEENEEYTVDAAFKQIQKNVINLLIWRVEKMQLVPLSRDQYGTFYEDDSYLLYAASEFGKFVSSSTKAHEVRGRLEIHIHFWLGATTSTDKSTTAAYKCVELDTYLGGTVTQHREVQGQESSRFKGYFRKHIKLLKGGVVTGLRHVEQQFKPRLFRVRGRRSPTIIQMPSISWEYMNSSDVFLLDVKEVIFLWVGKHASNIEKLQAATAGQEIRSERYVSLIFVDDGTEMELPECEKTIFSRYLNPKNRHGLQMNPDEEDFSLTSKDGELKLFKCVNEEGTYRVIEIKTGDLMQSDLTSDETCIIDYRGRTIWVWLGKKASNKDRIDAIRNAHGFVKKKNYPTHTPICKVIEGGEPLEFKCLFSSWQEQDLNNNVNNCLGKNKIIPANLSTETLRNAPTVASNLQLLDDGCGKLSIWRVKNSKLKEVPYAMYSRFHSRTNYIVHYKYAYGGNEFHVLYCWLGVHSSKSDQANAKQFLLSKHESINEIATLAYLWEGKETHHFFSIFRGRMTVFVDEYNDEIPLCFLLHVTGNRDYNTSAKQVPIKASSLDSNDVFILRCNKKLGYVWCGRGSTGDQREMAKGIANKLSFSEELLVIYEGQEKGDFWKHIGGFADNKNNKKSNSEYLSPLRLFHCWSAESDLKTDEIINFHQSDLISEDVMLLDVKCYVYVWIGSSAKNEEKKHAYEIAIEYLKNDVSRRDLQMPILVIREGREPVTFTGFFENWDSNWHKQRKHFSEVRKELEMQNSALEIELKQPDKNYTFDESEKFPVEKLLIRNPDNLPAGVDPSHKELHLTHDEFFAIFGMKYADFSQLAKWKQDNMKKNAALF